MGSFFLLTETRTLSELSNCVVDDGEKLLVFNF